jgi:hypothetical protein
MPEHVLSILGPSETGRYRACCNCGWRSPRSRVRPLVAAMATEHYEAHRAVDGAP